MPLNPGIILAGQQQQRPNYLGELAAVSQIKAQQEGTRRQNLLRDAAAGAVGDDGVSIDYNKLKAGLLSAGDIEGAMSVDKTIAANNKSGVDLEAAKLDRALKTLDVSTRLLGGVKDQASWERAVAQGRQLGLSGMDEVPAQYDPALVDGLLQQGLSAKERLTMALEERKFGEQRRHNLVTERPTYTYQDTADGGIVGMNTRDPTDVVRTGQQAPPKSGERITVGPDGTVIERGVLGAGAADGADPATLAKERAKAKAKLEADAPAARKSTDNAVANLSRLSVLAREIANDRNLWRITGMAGAAPDMPGSAAADVRAKLETLKSQIAFGVLQDMREASKTGGALGAVSERELNLLQNNLAALDTKQSPEAFMKSLNEIVSYAEGAAGRLKKAYAETYSQPQSGAGMNGGSVPQPKTPEERDALPPGTTYRAPDGSLRVRQ